MIPGLLTTKAKLELSSLLPDLHLSNGAQKQSPPQPHEERRNLSPCVPSFRHSGETGPLILCLLEPQSPIIKTESLDPSLPPSSDALELTGKKMARKSADAKEKRTLCTYSVLTTSSLKGKTKKCLGAFFELLLVLSVLVWKEGKREGLRQGN